MKKYVLTYYYETAYQQNIKKKVTDGPTQYHNVIGTYLALCFSPGSPGPPRRLLAVFAAGDAPDPTHPRLRTAELPLGMVQDHPPVRLNVDIP